jgi:hypothetical protein
MLPGYLHFECRLGLRIDLLNAALASLLTDHVLVSKAIASIGIKGLSYAVIERTVSSIKGHGLAFYLDGVSLEDEQARRQLDNIFSGDVVDLGTLAQWLVQLPLAPSVSALVRTILSHLVTRNYSEQRLKAGDALALSCHVVMFSAIIDALDPKFITATKFRIGEPCHGGDILSLTDSRWLNQVLMDLPTIEVDDVIAVDVVAVACIKALAGRIGARGESRIRKVGIGIDKGQSLLSPIVIEVLWCEPSLPESMTEHGLNAHARVDSLHEITGAIDATTDVLHLTKNLCLHGAMSISWHLAQREKNSSCYMVRFLVRDGDKSDAIEAFLVKGAAFDVVTSVVERQELNRRVVSVPIGTGNKATTVRFFEYLYLDKTVRVLPMKEDLDHYVQKTDYSVDVARSDLMLAWKKWRGRVVSEDA